MISIGKLDAADRAEGEAVFCGYNDFYQRELPAEMYDRAWTAFLEDTHMHALGAKLDGRLVGLTHFLTHLSTSWTRATCRTCSPRRTPAARTSRGH